MIDRWPPHDGRKGRSERWHRLLGGQTEHLQCIGACVPVSFDPSVESRPWRGGRSFARKQIGNTKETSATLSLTRKLSL
jgi:hypothetical protein